MPCYAPLLMRDTGQINPDTGKHVMEFFGRCLTLYDPSVNLHMVLYRVPCNRCLGCRLDYAREWSNRMLLELLDNPKAIFLTLTYDEEHVPMSEQGYMTCSVRDCQLFIKRLRKFFSGKKIRYFLASEYGPKHGRPHYHAIIFGLDLSDIPKLEFYKLNSLKQPLYYSDFFAKEIWKNGFCAFGTVSRDTCAYTARYMLKKLKGKDTVFYDDRGIEPEFTLSSRRPGIGLGYLEKHPEYSDKISVFDGTETYTFPMPKKLFDKIIDIDPKLYHKLKEARRTSASTNEFLEWQRTDLDYLEYLDMKESALYRKIKGISSETRLDI